MQADIPPATKQTYLDIIRAATDGDVLRALREDVRIDQTLHSTDKDEIYQAIFERYGQLNAQAAPLAEQKPRWQHEAGTWSSKKLARGCKHLIALLFLASLMSISSFADSAPTTALVPPANDQPGGSSLFVRRLAALSMIESGDNDNAIGQAGEVSRFQIMPDVFAKYFFVVAPPADIAARRLHAAARNPFTAWNIARSIMQDRCSAFETRFHRPPSDFEFYILWARPSWLLVDLSSGCHHQWPQRKLVTDRAHRFSNLVNR